MGVQALASAAILNSSVQSNSIARGVFDAGARSVAAAYPPTAFLCVTHGESVMAKAKPADTIEARLEELEGKVRTAEKWIWVVVTVAVIFGLGATQLWQALNTAKTLAEDASKVATQAKATAESASKEALAASDRMKSEGSKILNDLRPAFGRWVAEAQDRLHPASDRMYSLWVTKATGTLPMNAWSEPIGDWSRPEQEYPTEGAFNRDSGTWTCPKTAAYMIVLRLAIEPISGAYVDAGIDINGRRVTNAHSASTSNRGAIAVFTKRLNRGDVIAVRGMTESFTGTFASSQPLSSLLVVQISAD